MARLIELLNGPTIVPANCSRRDRSETVASVFLLLAKRIWPGGISRAWKPLCALWTSKPEHGFAMASAITWLREWQRAEGHPEDALRSSAGLLLTQDRTNRAEGVVFQASILNNWMTSKVRPMPTPTTSRRKSPPRSSAALS